MSIPAGTTPTFVLTFEDVDLTEAAHIYATFRGGSGETITKENDDLTITETTISVYLSQEETLMLSRGSMDIQVNWTYPDGSRAASEIARYALTRNLLPKVIE